MADFQDVVNAIKENREISDQKKLDAEKKSDKQVQDSIDNLSSKIAEAEDRGLKRAVKKLTEDKRVAVAQQADEKARRVTENASLTEIKDQKDALNIMASQIEANGGVALENAEYNKLDLAIKQKEFDLRKANATSKGAKAEIEKERRAAIMEQGTYLQKISAGIAGIGASMKDSAKAALAGAGKGIMGILKGTLFAGLFIAVAKFLQSPLYAKMVDYITGTLIPTLQSFYDAFFGPNGGVIKGFKKLFSDESGIGAIVLGIGTVVAAIAVFKVAKLFGTIAGGVSKLGGFLGNIGSRFKGLKLPGAAKGGVPGGGPASTVAKTTKGAGGFGKAIGSAGKGIGSFISGILKGVASGLAALANPATLIGLAAVSAAIIAVSAALRIAAPAFEPIGKMMDSFGSAVNRIFKGLGSFVESTGKAIKSVIVGIGESIGKVVDKITAMKTAGTEATTKQIKELSNIPSDKLFAAAKGIDAMKAALAGFGGGTFSKISDSLFGGGGPIEKIVELAKNVNPLLKAAEAISVISAAGGDYAMAQAELKRRERVAELEKNLGGGDSYRGTRGEKRKKSDEAELAALEKQKMELKLSGSRARGGPMNADEMYLVGETGPELVMPKSASMVQSEQKTDAILKSALDKSSNGQQAINVVAPQAKVTNNSANTNVSNTSYVGNPDMAFQLAAGT